MDLKHARLWLLAASLPLWGCGSSPTSPSTLLAPTFQSTQPITGVWSGLIQRTDVTDPAYILVYQFTLRIDGTPDAYSGHLDVFHTSGQSSQYTPLNVDVQGSRRADGTVGLSGSRDTQRLVELAARVNGSSGLDGTLEFGNDYSNGTINRMRARILSASWQSSLDSTTAAPGLFHGHWKGQMTRLECSGRCSYYEASGGFVNLLLAQSGGLVTGELEGALLDGKVAGLSLHSTRDYQRPGACPASGPYDFIILCRETWTLSATLDPNTARLTGTLQRHQEGTDYSSGLFSWTGSYHLDLSR